MSEPNATPAPATVVATPAPKLNAIQLIQREIISFQRQREQHMANVHATEGAIQAAQHLIGVLTAEAAKAEALAASVGDTVAIDGLKVAEKVVEVTTGEKP
jgi:hypothetical protein